MKKYVTESFGENVSQNLNAQDFTSRLSFIVNYFQKTTRKILILATYKCPCATQCFVFQSFKYEVKKIRKYVKTVIVIG